MYLRSLYKNGKGHWTVLVSPIHSRVACLGGTMVSSEGGGRAVVSMDQRLVRRGTILTPHVKTAIPFISHVDTQWWDGMGCY